MKKHNNPYSLKERIICHILKHLITTLPMLAGYVVMTYAVCAYSWTWTGFVKLCIELVLGGGLLALGAIILQYIDD